MAVAERQRNRSRKDFMPSFDSIDRFVAQSAPFLTDGEEWWLRSREKSSKFQTPSSKEAPSTKLKTRPARRLPRHLFLGFDVLRLELLWSLGFDAWCFARRWLRNRDVVRRHATKIDVQFSPRLANVARFMHWRSSRILHSIGRTRSALVALTGAAGLFALTEFCPRASGAEIKAAAHFRKDIQPILKEYCYDCHGDGMDKGNVAFDEFKSDEELLGKRDLWWAVLKNLRAGIMPPAKKPRPPETEKRRLEDWIKYEAFGLAAQDPDPGRGTIRRLNRVEYRNTIRDLMGIDFKAAEEFPPDDTGYGFDNIGDVLTVSPLLLEKYMQAAENIVAAAVPTVAMVVREGNIAGTEFHALESKANGDRLTFYQEAKVSHMHT